MRKLEAVGTEDHDITPDKPQQSGIVIVVQHKLGKARNIALGKSVIGDTRVTPSPEPPRMRNISGLAFMSGRLHDFKRASNKEISERSVRHEDTERPIPT